MYTYQKMPKIDRYIPMIKGMINPIVKAANVGSMKMGAYFFMDVAFINQLYSACVISYSEAQLFTKIFFTSSHESLPSAYCVNAAPT